MRDRLVELREDALCLACQYRAAGDDAGGAAWELLALVCKYILGLGLC